MINIKLPIKFFAALLALYLPANANASFAIDYPDVNYSVSYYGFYDGYGQWNDYNKPLAFLSFKIDFSAPDTNPSENHGLFPGAIYDVKFRERALHLDFTHTPSQVDAITWGLDSHEKAAVEEGELSGNHYYYQTSIFFDLFGRDNQGKTLSFVSNLEFFYACPSIGESLNDLKDPNCFPEHLSPGETKIWVQNTTGPQYFFMSTVGRVSTPESASITMFLLGLIGIAALRKCRTKS